ncbi:hypothetical protein [Arthrobacter sp. NPDC056493]|uniref:hypothetical protein n=1 Tax=Arthrobacter sp. NPDC056493 TaxID=3345839 RepID=UPI003671F638
MKNQQQISSRDSPATVFDGIGAKVTWPGRRALQPVMSSGSSGKAPGKSNPSTVELPNQFVRQL